MESTTEIVLEIEEDAPDVVLPPDEPVARALPFSFAKRHGVLIRDFVDGDRKSVV